MAESEAAGGGGNSECGEGGGPGSGARAMVGGSLPPRKRLLAGLKQNGLWPAASSSQDTSPTSVRPTSGSAIQDGTAEEGAGHTLAAAGGGGGDAKGVCMSCGATESSAFRRVKRNGVVKRVCNFCALLFNKNMNCPHCLVVCPVDAKDPSVWLQCSRCQRYVHVECEKKSSPSSTLTDANSFICSECVQGKNHNEHSNVLPGLRAKRCAGTLGGNCSLRTGTSCATAEFSARSGNCASCATAECSSPCNKKLRGGLREPRSKSNDAVAEDGGKFDGAYNDGESGMRRSCPISRETAAANAASVAAVASRAAAAAKAYASAKATTAVKAAAVAKAALDAAAIAARAEADARSAFRSSVASEQIVDGGGCKGDAAFLEQRKGKGGKPELKVKEDEIVLPVATGTSIADEELARQLHRAINSSPRISRSLTPSCRKPSGKLGPATCPADCLSAWSRAGLSSAVESSSQSKQQPTKPRSNNYKEVKRIDARVLKCESKTCSGNYSHVTSELTGCTVAADIAEQNGAPKPEPAHSNGGTLIEQDSRAGLSSDAAIASSVVVVKMEIDCVNAAGRHVVLDSEVSGTTDVSQAAALLDEVLMSEADAEAAAAAAEEYCTNPLLKDSVNVSEPILSKETIPRINGLQADDVEQRVDKEGGVTAGVATSSQVPSCALPEGCGALGNVAVEGDQWGIYGGGDSFQTVQTHEEFVPSNEGCSLLS